METPSRWLSPLTPILGDVQLEHAVEALGLDLEVAGFCKEMKSQNS